MQNIKSKLGLSIAAAQAGLAMSHLSVNGDIEKFLFDVLVRNIETDNIRNGVLIEKPAVYAGNFIVIDNGDIYLGISNAKMFRCLADEVGNLLPVENNGTAICGNIYLDT